MNRKGCTQDDILLEHNPWGKPPSVYLCPSDMTASMPDGVNKWIVGGQYQSFGRQLREQRPGVGPLVAGATDADLEARIADIRDGTSNTVLFAERYSNCPPPCDPANGRTAWLGTTPTANWDSYFATNDTSGKPIISPPQDAPSPDQCNGFTTQSAHPGAMNIVLADGSVRTVSPSITTIVWTNVIMPDDGQTLGDW